MTWWCSASTSARGRSGSSGSPLLDVLRPLGVEARRQADGPAVEEVLLGDRGDAAVLQDVPRRDHPQPAARRQDAETLGRLHDLLHADEAAADDLRGGVQLELDVL